MVPRSDVSRRRQRHFAVALHRVSVPDGQQRAGHMHGDVQGRSGDQFLVVEVPGVGSRRPARDAADQRIRSHAYGSEEWSQFEGDAGSELRGPRTRVETNELEAHVGKIVWKRAAAWNEAGHSVRMEELEPEHLHFQHITAFGAFDPDGTGQRMSARTTFCDGSLDGLQGIWYFGLRHAGGSQALQSARDHRLRHGSCLRKPREGRA